MKTSMMLFLVLVTIIVILAPTLVFSLGASSQNAAKDPIPTKTVAAACSMHIQNSCGFIGK